MSRSGYIGRRKRVDANQRAIAQALTQAGCCVLSIADAGAGAPDMVLGFVAKSGPKAAVAEVKTEAGTLTPDQVKWRCWWTGPFAIFRTVNDALAWYHAERQR